MRNKIDIKEKSRGAIRNISGLNEEFQGMKLQFHRDGTPVSSHETPAHTSKNHPVFRNLSLLTLLLLFFSAGWNENGVWGQEYTIQYKNGSRQTNIPERVDTVYIPDGMSRELYVPELRNNDGRAGGSPNYRWYVRWYRADENGDPIAIDNKFKSTIVDLRNKAVIEGGTVDTKIPHAAALHETPEKTSLFWYRTFFDDNKNTGLGPDQTTTYYISTATGASTILYTRNAGDTEDIVICDVSMNTDENLSGSTLTEPTLSKRYKFVIRPASEIAEKIKNAGNNGIEHYEIASPSDAKGINIQMKTFPSNYCWYANEQDGTILSGDHYVYDGGKSGSLASDKQVIGLGEVSSNTTINVYAETSDGQKSPLLATFKIIPQANAAFMLEENVKNSSDPRRNPAAHSDLYEAIGAADFDMDARIPSSELSSSNNLCSTPMSAESTTYAFLNPDITMYADHNHAALQNQYGLYRSANVPGVSDGGEYFWFFALRNNTHAGPVYDRTYTNTNGAECGYFFYTDASNEPGRWVKLKLDDVICQYTELTVTAWVNDMTTWNETNDGKPLPPNININFIGKTGDKEVVLHRFTSGDALTDYSDTYLERPANKNVGKWQQLCYSFSISEQQTYKEYYLEVQNNTAHTYGADYAIDDVRVYKSKPNIKVQRYDACDASVLTVSLDYATMLRNMGWTANESIVDENTQLYSNDPENSFDLVKYRFGLNGPEAVNPTKVSTESHVGNTYFSFVEGFDENTTENVIDITDRTLKNDEDPDPIVLEKGHQYRWVRVNKSLRVPVPQSMYSFRVINSTVYEDKNYPSSREEALRREKILNLRAVKDYNTAVKLYNNKQSDYVPDSDSDGKITEIALQGLTEKNVTNEGYEGTYLEVIEELYSRLQIPRIRCPWREADDPDRVYLYALDVNNTDLKYVDEQVGLDSDGNPIVASGEYHVVLMGAQAVENWEVPEGDADPSTSFNLKDPCVLISPFEVQPAVRITVETVNNTGALACLGTLRHIEADLIGTDGTELSVNYSFDWFLGSMADYDKLTTDGIFGDYDLKHAIEEFRKDKNIEREFDIDDVRDASNVDPEVRNGLIHLFEQDLLQIATTEFTRPIQNDSIVAMPFIVGGNVVDDKIYCTEITAVRLGTYSEDVPELHPGYTSKPFKDEVSLRLGHPNMGESIVLHVPLQKGFEYLMASEAHSLKTADISSGVAMYLNNPANEYPEIGTAILDISRDADDAVVTISLKEEAKEKLQEGQRYELLIPFAQYDDNENRLSSECDGLITLPVKIVPQYLTWTGDTDDNWYDENLWKQSTKGDLYFDGYAESPDTDANGSDAIDDAYSPLYFTKITLSENKELSLIDESASDNRDTDKRFLKGWSEPTSDGKDMADSIRYEMAVVNAVGKIEPYYINKVSEIYFKPNASMYHQDYLDYQKAWVDFEMEEGKPYWISAPLHNVYAGDMYAPSSNGRQETKAFEDITYSGKHESGTTNSRWNPAFYQKAWDKAIAYVTKEGDSHNADNATDVETVKNNWSIEYNDVWVPYSEGKGFYARVEDLPESNTTGSALVRLPKADTKYSYEASTRAAGNLSDGDHISRTDAYTLMDKVNGTTGTDIIIDLSDDTDADGNGEHFLVGNPYMAYLKMTGDNSFLKENENVLASKFWTLDRNTGSIVVGTPDVTDWDNAAGAHVITDGTDSYIAPMTAFFIEVKDNVADENKKITFSTSMTAAKPGNTENVYTRSYEATNPQLTLTASSAKGKSRAAVVQSFDASNQYESDRDAVTLLDSELDAPTVYTVAGNYAAAVNAVHDCQNIPLGVYAKDNEEVELTVEGASQLTEPLYLYDAVTRSSTPIEGDSYTLNLTGSSHGRYFLTTDAGNIRVESDIRIYSPNGGQLIIAASPSDKLKQVQIYDLSGRMVESRKNIGVSTCQLNVTKGIYIVRVISEQGSAEAKLRIR